MIRIENLSKAFDGLQVLDKVCLHIKKGEFVAITGKSGSGKSTLLNCIGALERIDSGRIVIDGRDLKDVSEKDAAGLRSAVFGYIFQSFHLEPTYTVFKNIEIPLLIARQSKEMRAARIAEVLEKVDLSDKGRVVSSVLSGGEKQRVAIARALSNHPKIILADEPTGNLDTANGRAVIALLRTLADEGITVLLVTHNIEDAKAADRIITIEDGRVVC